MGDGFGTEERLGAGKALVRLGYALAGALVAVLVSWAASYAIQSMTCLASLSLFFESAAMGATLMLWASFKPSRGSAVSIACEAMVVVGGMLAVRLGFESLFSSGSGFFHDPASWLMGALLFMLLGGYGFALPASWALGSSARWARRPLGWVVVELLVAVAAGLLATLTMRSFRRGTASAQAACRETAGRNGGTGAPARSPRTRIINPHNSRWTTAAAGSDSITVKKLVITNAEEGSDASTLLAAFVASVAVCALAFAFFFACLLPDARSGGGFRG